MHLRLGDIMSQPVVTARPSETVRPLARRMNLHRIECVVVVDHRRAVGVVTERDVLRMTAKGLSPDDMTAEDIMTKPADRRARERFEKYLHGPPPPWSFV